MTSSEAGAARRGEWFGHPRGLTYLFLTEMWEKFSFFGMRALLVYYMTKQLLMSQSDASLVYGLYAAFVYLTPILGGYVSDRWLGRRRSVIAGGSIMAAGHFMMAFEPLFYPALATIAVGNGLFLPSLPSQIGALYGDGDPRRRQAYSVYYVGINLGGFLAPLVCGTLGEVYGWHYGFTAAGIGMGAGLVIYIMGSRHLPADTPRRLAPRAEVAGAARWLLLAVIALSVVVFRIAYEQTGNTVALWTDTAVDRRIGGDWTIPMTWFQALNPLLVFLMTPFLLARWGRLAERGRDLSAIYKMALGAGIVALSYAMVAAVAALTESGAQVHWLWLFAFFVVLTFGELYILPIGLGLFARLAPPALAATVIAAWFLASFAGNLLSGWVGGLWSGMTPAAFFGLMAAVAALAASLLLAIGVRTGDPDAPSQPR